MIDNKDITVVVQGPVQALADRPMDEGITAKSLQSVRQQLPGATIILSTWEGQPYQGLDYDELVLNTDPGPNINRYQADGSPGKVNNNRQVVSTINGLKRVNTKYAMKLRSDNFLISDNFKILQQQFPKRSDQYRFLTERVVVNNTFTREFAKGLPVLFHACDFFYFGRTEDVVALWDFPLFEDLPYDSTATGIDQHPGFPNYLIDCCQKLWLAAINKYHPEIKLAHLHDYNDELKRQNDICYANNLVVGEPDVIGLGLNSKFIGTERANRLVSTITYLGHFGWQRLYRRYCDPSYEIPGNLPKLLRLVGFRALLLPSKWLEGRSRLAKRRRKYLAQG